ncbi:uncharacterized protein LOC135830664 [Sycon ciliatum]|uniref:uncharacterized protein LOC135830664 n=1 Tax=Sycon ciliatum TaxID=27933 RepID=UPI0031F67C4F
MLPMPQSPSAAEIFLEEEEDAVFGVKLRRVTYNSGLTDSFLQWQTEKVRTLRAATQERLIKELLPEHGQIDATFLITFLGTYRTFMSTEDLLAMIRERVSTHCQFHSLTTISRSNSESSVGSASTERSQSGISISSGDEELMVTGEGLTRIESSDARQGAASPPLSSSPPMAYDDEDMLGTEELARSVIGRSLSMSTFSAGGMSPSLRGSRALVSQRIRMFSLMTADRDDSHRARPGLIRARAATVHAHRRGGELSPDICSSVDSPSQSPQPPYRTIVTDSKQHVRTGSDGTQRDSGNGTESQEESAPGEQDTPERNPSAVRRKLPFTRGEATVNERVSPDEARDFLGSGFHTPRPGSSQELASASKGTQDGMPPRSLSFSPSSSSKARSRAQQSAWQGHSKPILRPTMEESTSETTPPSPYAASPEDNDECSGGEEEEEFDDEGLEVTMIDDLPPASAMPATAGGEDGEAMASSATPRSVTSNHLDDLRLDPLDDDPALRSDASTAEPSEDKPGKEDTASDILRPLSQHGPDPKDIFKSVLSVLRVWLDQYPEDFKLPQLQMRLFGLLEECRIAPGPEFDDVYSLAEVLSSESSPVPGSTFSSPCTPTASAVNTLAMKKSSTLVSLHQRHRSTMASKQPAQPFSYSQHHY